MGNRLVTVLAAIKYSIENERVLIIDWSDGQFAEFGVNAFNSCFALNEVEHLKSINEIANWSELSHSSELFKANKEKGVYDLYKTVDNAFWNKLPMRLFPKGRARSLRKKWKPINNQGTSLVYGSDLRNDLKEDVVYFIDFLPIMSYVEMTNYIRLTSTLETKIKTIQEDYKLHEAIGVHVRYTDKKPTRQISDLVEYLKKINNLSIFLCTDSVYVEELFATHFKNVILFPKTKPKLYGEGLHQWALYNNEEKKKQIIFEESVIEMFLLSRCKQLLYQGNSTFSNISKTYHSDITKCVDWQTLN